MKKIIFFALVALSLASCGKSYRAHSIVLNYPTGKYIPVGLPFYGVADDIKKGDTITISDCRTPGKYVIDDIQ